MFKDLEEFHKKFGLHQLDNPGFLPDDYMMFRIQFLMEELIELMKACHTKELDEAFDALIDLTYVALGTAHLMHLPFEEGWKEVHSSNMKKELQHEHNKSKRGFCIDVVKPPGWVPPNLKKFFK